MYALALLKAGIRTFLVVHTCHVVYMNLMQTRTEYMILKKNKTQALLSAGIFLV